MIARPKYNRISKKWNIACMVDGEEIPLGHQTGICFKNVEFGSKDKAIEYIENREGMELKVEEAKNVETNSI
ncbi:hypothetical protein AB8U03_15465 [Clostridium sp. Mt-5]|uniref:Uncharacterized protein n=1 Tax=Clostridium moutaii TaxID=3240932 RepID=A0ABV4BTM8_9CLOT